MFNPATEAYWIEVFNEGVEVNFKDFSTTGLFTGKFLAYRFEIDRNITSTNLRLN